MPLRSHRVVRSGVDMGTLYKEPVAEHNDYWCWVESEHPGGAGYVRAVGITAAAYSGRRRAEAEQLAHERGVPVTVERPYKITLKRKYLGPHNQPWVYQCDHPEDGAERPTGTDDYPTAEKAARDHAGRAHPTDTAEFAVDNS